MRLPFTESQFLENLGQFNEATWPVLILLWVTSLVVAIQLGRGIARSSVVLALLAVHWLWSGAIYHALFFSTINPAGRLFAGLFVVEGLLLAVAAADRSLTFEWEASLRQVTGLALLFVALLYPGLTLASGHAWPNGPLFGVPCPTLLFTAGAILCARPPVPKQLVIVPLVWSLIGGSAALTLGMPHDVLLFVAGAALLPLLLPSARVHVLDQWGTDLTDATRAMTGDRLAPHPAYEMTLTRVVRATPQEVWPWLLQLGYRRGGLYSYDWLDRLFGYLDRPSATSILAEYQHLAPGDVIPIGHGSGFPVRIVDSNHTLVLGGTERGTTWSWEIALEPLDGGSTRIISRSRGDVPHTFGTRIFIALLGPAAFLMTRRMLKGLATRAERLHAAAQRA